jgi:hypothetical protein
MRRLGVLALVVAAACTEQSTAPGACPNFCPTDSINIRDTIFADVIDRDSSFQGYLQAYQSSVMSVADLPGVVDSRAFITTDTVRERIAPKLGDTTTLAKSFDSLRVRFIIARRPKNTTNLRLKLYRLPVALDTSTTFAALDSAFSAAPVDSLNVTDLLATTPTVADTQFRRVWTTDSMVREDSSRHILQIGTDSSLGVYFFLDSTRAAFSAADSGRSAWGLRVSADSFASVGLATLESGGGAPVVRWYYHVTYPDTGSTTKDTVANKVSGLRFDSYVFSPPTPPVDSNLAVGGAPSARSLIRVKMPAFLHDTIDIVRATLVLVPAVATPGAPSDSFSILVRPVLADLGAKSPLNTNAVLTSSGIVHTATTDTVRIEVTNLVRAWSVDTSLTTSFFLQAIPEASSFAQARFYATNTPAFRPTLHVTYVNRFEFGRQ